MTDKMCFFCCHYLSSTCKGSPSQVIYLLPLLHITYTKLLLSVVRSAKYFTCSSSLHAFADFYEKNSSSSIYLTFHVLERKIYCTRLVFAQFWWFFFLKINRMMLLHDAFLSIVKSLIDTHRCVREI